MISQICIFEADGELIRRGENGRGGHDPAIYADPLTAESMSIAEEEVQEEVYEGLKANEALTEAGCKTLAGLARSEAEARDIIVRTLRDEYSGSFFEMLLDASMETTDRPVSKDKALQVIQAHVGATALYT